MPRTKTPAYHDEVEASHPIMVDTPEAYQADVLALTLIHNRESKRSLVNLIRWLIMDEAKTVRELIEHNKKMREMDTPQEKGSENERA